MKKRKTVFAAMLSVLFGMSLLAGCSGGSDTTSEVSIDANAEQPLKGIKLTMAIDAEYAPFESVNADGEIVGFDVDLNEEISKILGYEYELNDMEFTGLVSSLSTGKCDYIISALTYSAERDKVADFSDGYFQPIMALVYKKGQDYTSMDDFKGKIVGTTLGSVYEQVVKRIENVTLKTYDVGNTVLPIIGTDELDAFLTDTTNAIAYCAEDETLDYMVVPESFASDLVSAFSVLFPNDSPYLPYFNQAIQELKDNGKMDELIEKWFGEQYFADLEKAQNG